MIKSPSTYAEWVPLLDKFSMRENDAEVIEAIKGGTITWQSGVSERFAKRFADALNKRINAASDRFSKSTGRSNMSERTIVTALTDLRREFRKLMDAVDIQGIPEDVRASLKKMISDSANQMQSSLESSARSDRTGRLGVLIKNTRINSL